MEVSPLNHIDGGAANTCGTLLCGAAQSSKGPAHGPAHSRRRNLRMDLRSCMCIIILGDDQSQNNKRTKWAEVNANGRFLLCMSRLVRNSTGTAEIAHDMIGWHVSRTKPTLLTNTATINKHGPVTSQVRVCNCVSATIRPKQDNYGSEQRVSRSTSRSLLRVGSAVCELAV